MTPSLSPGAETLLRMIGWTFLPDLLSRTLLNTYRRALLIVPPIINRRYKGILPPQPGSPSDYLQRRICFALVIVGYLVYTAAQAYLRAPPSFYALLGVSPGVEEADLNRAWRTWARWNHPDRVGPAGEPAFVAAREGYDVLKSEMKRQAYDKFGPEVVQWGNECKTMGDYLERGLMGSIGFWLVSALGMVLYAVFGEGGFGAFWRYNLFFTTACLELLLILSPTPEALRSLFPSRVAYQHIRFLHQLFISLSIAITRVGPVLMPEKGGLMPDLSGRGGEKAWERERNALVGIAKGLSGAVARLDRGLSGMIAGQLRAAHGPLPQDHIPPEGIPLQTPNGAPKAGMTESSAAAGLGGLELNDEIMRKLSSEVRDMVVEKNLKRHPLLARIWWEGVRVGRESLLRQATANSAAQNAAKMTGVEESQTTTAVDPSQNLPQANGWKKDYLERRARSEEPSPSPSRSSSSSPSPPPAFPSTMTAIRDDLPPKALRNLSFGSGNESPTRSEGRSPSFLGGGLRGSPAALKPTLRRDSSEMRKESLERTRKGSLDRLSNGKRLSGNFSPLVGSPGIGHGSESSMSDRRRSLSLVS